MFASAAILLLITKRCTDQSAPFKSNCTLLHEDMVLICVPYIDSATQTLAVLIYVVMEITD